MKSKYSSSILLLLVFVLTACTREPVVSGPKQGVRPGPYIFWVATGPNRGQETCFICETENRPAVVVFARNTSDSLGKLARKLDKALADHKATELRSWITFIGKDHDTFDRPLLDWTRQHSLRSIPVGTFKEDDGPPTYRVAREADVTVVLFVKKKVQASFGFRRNELTDEDIQRVLDAVAALAAKMP
jgi:hypothetical protein